MFSLFFVSINASEIKSIRPIQKQKHKKWIKLWIDFKISFHIMELFLQRYQVFLRKVIHRTFKFYSSKQQKRVSINCLNIMSSKNVKNFYARDARRNRTFWWDFVRSRFAKSLQKLVFKKSPNNKVFMHFQQEFMDALKFDSFKEINKKRFLNKNGIPSK